MKRVRPASQLIVLPALIALAGWTTIVRGQGTDTGPLVSVHLEYWSTEFDPDLGAYGGTKKKTSAETTVPVGQTGAAYLAAGSFRSGGAARPGPGGRTVSGGLRPGEDLERARARLPAQAPRVWWAEFTPRRTESGVIVLDVIWECLESARRGEPERVCGGRRRIEIAEGDRHVLEYVDLAEQDGHGPRNAVIQLRAEILEEPATADVVRYDMWYRFRSGEAREKTSRLMLAGRLGEELTFRFRPLRFRVSGPGMQADDTTELVIDMSGTLQGHVQADGSVRIEMQVVRSLERSRASRGRSGRVGYNAAKTFTIVPGETVSLELPPLQQSSYAAALAIDSPGFFGGSSDAIILTLHPDPGD